MKKAFLLALVLLASSLAVSLSAQSSSDLSPKISALKSKLAELESAQSADPVRQEKLKDLYTQSLAYLESAEVDREQARDYSESLRAAPATLAQLQLELKGLESKATRLPESLDALEQELLNSQTELLLLNSLLSEGRVAIASEQELDLSVMLAQALQQLADSQNNLNLPVSEKSVELAEAQRALRTSELAAKSARVDKLQQQSLSRDARMS